LCSIGTQLSPSKKSHSPPQIFGSCLLSPNGRMDQNATWYGDMPRPRRDCGRWGPIHHPLRKGHSSSHFSAHVGWITIPLGTEVGLGPCHIVLDRDPGPPRKGAQHPCQLFGPLCSGTVAHLSNCWPLAYFTKKQLHTQIQ